jgi:hypothetical protein
MGDRLQLVALIASVLLFLGVLEMVRRRRLMERYALLWMLATVVLIVLAVWRNGLAHVSRAFGIIYAPNALFFVAFGFVLLLLLHFSSAVSRLSDQTKVLAQRLALLEERVRHAEQPESDEPSASQTEQTEHRRLAQISSD